MNDTRLNEIKKELAEHILKTKVSGLNCVNMTKGVMDNLLCTKSLDVSNDKVCSVSCKYFKIKDTKKYQLLSNVCFNLNDYA